MRRIEFNVPAFGKTIGLNVPNFNNNLDKTQKLLKLIDYSKTALYLILIFLLPLNLFFSNNQSLVVGNRFASYENSAFVFAIAFGILIFGLTLAEVAIGGFKRLTDPSGLLVALLFSLLVTTAAVLITNQATENTFGSLETSSSPAFKALSGLAVITYLFYFYLSASLVKTKKLAQYFKIALFSSLVLITLFRLIPVDTTEFFIVAIWPIVYFLKSIQEQVLEKKQTGKFKLYFKIIILAILLWNVSLGITKLTARSLEQVMVVLLITQLIFFTYKLVVNRKLLSDQFKELTESFSDKNKSIKNVINAFIKLDLFYIGLTLVVISVTKISFNLDLSTLFNVGINSTENAFKIINTSTRTLFVGKGASESNFQNTFFYSVIVAHGIIGVTAYLMAWLFGIYSALKSSVKSVKETTLFNKLINGYLIFIPVLSFFVYPGFITLLFWWILFAVSIAKPSKEFSSKDFYTINKLNFYKLKLNLSKSKKVRLIFSLLGVAIALGILYIFNSNIGEVI